MNTNIVPSFSALPEILQRVAKLRIVFAPRRWYLVIAGKRGSYTLSIDLLLKILEWYYPAEVKDSQGNVIGYKKKFYGEKLQQTCSQLAAMFNKTKRQIRYALQILKELGLIKIEIKKRVVTKTDQVLGNVCYIEPDMDAIEAISIEGKTTQDEASTICHSYDTQRQTYTNQYQDIDCTKVSGGVENAPVLQREEEAKPTEDQKERRQVLSDLNLLLKPWNSYLQKECDRSSLSDLKKALQSVKRKNARDGYVKGGYLVRALRSIREGLDDLPRPKTPLVSEIKKMEYGDRLWVREDGKLYPAQFEEWNRNEERVYRVTCRIWKKLYTFDLDQCLIFPNGGEPPEPDRPVWGPQAERLKPARPGTPVLFIHNGEEKEGRFSTIEESLSGPIAYVFCEGIGDLKIDPEELQVKADFYCGIEDDVILDYSQEIQPHELRSLDPENRYTFIAWNPYTGKWYAFEYNGFLYGEDGLLVRGTSKHGDIMVPIGRVRFQNAALPEGKHFFAPPPGFIRSDYRRP